MLPGPKGVSECLGRGKCLLPWYPDGESYRHRHRHRARERAPGMPTPKLCRNTASKSPGSASSKVPQTPSNRPDTTPKLNLVAGGKPPHLVLPIWRLPGKGPEDPTAPPADIQMVRSAPAPPKDQPGKLRASTPRARPTRAQLIVRRETTLRPGRSPVG